MQCAENFGQALQVAVIGGGLLLQRWLRRRRRLRRQFGRGRRRRPRSLPGWRTPAAAPVVAPAIVAPELRPRWCEGELERKRNGRDHGKRGYGVQHNADES